MITRSVDFDLWSFTLSSTRSTKPRNTQHTEIQLQKRADQCIFSNPAGISDGLTESVGWGAMISAAARWQTTVSCRSEATPPLPRSLTRRSNASSCWPLNPLKIMKKTFLSSSPTSARQPPTRHQSPTCEISLTWRDIITISILFAFVIVVVVVTSHAHHTFPFLIMFVLRPQEHGSL